ncbi:archaetidylserine decarboxylase [Candidatus Photodesmus blepharus]|nr:archaetidylserine decarboxylase [Candidatus Photodesmus blepharus]
MNNIRIRFQYWIPQFSLTHLIGKLASVKARRLTTIMIRLFIKYYKINMDEVLHTDLKYFKTLNDFFARELREGVRPITEGESVITYPVDACINQFGLVDNGKIIQAKGHNFSTTELLGGDAKLAEEFAEGNFATLYLSPRDYHRVHMPCDGVLRKMIYIPGDLFQVNVLTSENVPNLFARNERVVCIFDTKFGRMAQILIGAMIVGSIELVWAGIITPPRGNTIYHWNYPERGNKAIALKKGKEMGCFRIGSTVINLFVKNQIEFDETVQNNTHNAMGTSYARRKVQKQ